ncbi:MAG: hypothetical protein GWO23_02200 [Gammaproteobacteria bacterium]|nr:hypothetical protein [Gammaproteobacteria bacterium]NIS49636.1 hypothetical protein [Phycisphaerae bacterium]
MAEFDYDDTLATDKDKVRFFIGDKVQDKGPLPQGENFSDDEINGLITSEGSWEAAVAAAFETLAAKWVTLPSFQADNFSISRSHIAKNFQAQAELWRKGHGLSGPGVMFGSPGSAAVTRIDAYSDEYATGET